MRHAREANGVEARVGTLVQMRYPSASRDVVTLIEVIEHLYDPGQTVNELARIIRSGGLLYVSTPNEDSIYQWAGNLYYRLRGLDWCVNLCPTWNLYHVYGFSPRSLRFALESSGFRVERMDVFAAGGTPLPRRSGFWGLVERAGIAVVDRLGRVMGRNPYMLAWARRI